MQNGQNSKNTPTSSISSPHLLNICFSHALCFSLHISRVLLSRCRRKRNLFKLQICVKEKVCTHISLNYIPILAKNIDEPFISSCENQYLQSWEVTHFYIGQNYCLKVDLVIFSTPSCLQNGEASWLHDICDKGGNVNVLIGRTIHTLILFIDGGPKWAKVVDRSYVVSRYCQ